MMAAAKGEEKYRRTILERNKFFETTDISGFGLIQSSNSRIEIVVWYVMIFLFGMITIRNIIDLTNQFKDQTPITAVSMSSINRLTGLKPVIIMLDVAWPELNPEYFDTDLSPFDYNIPLNEEFDIALQFLNTKTKLLNERWPYVLMPLMTRYCVFMSLCEQVRYCKWNFVGGYLKLIEKFLNHGRHLGVEFHQLHQSFGYQIMNWTGFNHAGKWRDYNYLLSCRGSLSLSKTVSFTYILNPPNEMVGDSYEAFSRPVWHMTFDLTRPLFDSFERLLNRSSEEISNWYMNLTKPQVSVGTITETMSYKKKPITAKSGELTRAWMEIYSSYHIVGRYTVSPGYCSQYGYVGQRYQCCSTPMKQQNCKNRCGANSITNRCGCLPLLWEAHLYGNYDWCTPEQYMTCLANDTRIAANEYPCMQTCPQRCDYYVVNLRNDRTFDIAPSKFQVKLMGSEGLQYSRFREVYGQSMESYLAELGGTFDFWLGASVLGGVHLVVYVIKQIGYAFKKDTKTGKNVRKMVGQASHHEPIIEMMTSLTMAISTKQEENEEEKEICCDKCIQIQEQLHEEKRMREAGYEELKIENDELKEKIAELYKLIGVKQKSISMYVASND